MKRCRRQSLHTNGLVRSRDGWRAVDPGHGGNEGSSGVRKGSHGPRELQCRFGKERCRKFFYVECSREISRYTCRKVGLWIETGLVQFILCSN